MDLAISAVRGKMTRALEGTLLDDDPFLRDVARARAIFKDLDSQGRSLTPQEVSEPPWSLGGRGHHSCMVSRLLGLRACRGFTLFLPDVVLSWQRTTRHAELYSDGDVYPGIPGRVRTLCIFCAQDPRAIRGGRPCSTAGLEASLLPS